MKKCLLAVLLCCGFFSGSAFALPQDVIWVMNGETNLSNDDLVDANSNFLAAVALNPADQPANVLLAATRLALLAQTPAGSNFLTGLGFQSTGRNFYDWTSQWPINSKGEYQFPANYNSGTAILYYTNTLMPAVSASLTNLANVTDPNFQLSLPGTVSLGTDGSDAEDVTIDYGDVQVLQTMLTAVQFFGCTLTGNNADANLQWVESAITNKNLTIQSFLSEFPNFLTLQDKGAIAGSEAAGTNAIALYFGASAFILNERTVTNALFQLPQDDYPREAEFRTELTNALLSLSTPTEFAPNNVESTGYLAPYFAGDVSLRSLAPNFIGNAYVTDSVPSYTFDGMLPDLPSYVTEGALLKKFGPLTGIYFGNLYDTAANSPFAGTFAAYFNTSTQATIIGYDQAVVGESLTSGGFSVQVTVNAQNHWQVSNSTVSGSGSVDKNGNFTGVLNFANGDSVELNFSYELSPPGPFQSQSGYYTGSLSGKVNGQSFSGSMSAVLAADGEMVFQLTVPSEYSDGGYAQFDSDNNSFNASTGGSITFYGTNFVINPSTLQIKGNFTNYGNNNSTIGGTFTMSRSSSIIYETAPVINTDLPANVNAGLGDTTVFRLGVSGSAPLSYQWYWNGNPISGATASTLTVSNQLWTTTGPNTISATINNVIGGTNSQTANVNVTTETNVPTIAISVPTSGELWSNPVFTVIGVATDPLAVTQVVCSVNNGPYTNMATFTTPTNWYTSVALSGGSNSISAYAVNAGGISSKTNTVWMEYIVSGSLIVVTNGEAIITPNYNGSLLQIGKNYSMTATPVNGFTFINWEGFDDAVGVLNTNKPTVTFTMEPNLLLIADLHDTEKPVLSITNATSGMLESNDIFTVMGLTTDNVAVASVTYSFDGSPYTNTVIPTGNKWMSAPLSLSAGTNTFSVYATDTSENNSVTNTVNLVFLSTNQLTVLTTGKGTISPNYSNAWLFVGRNYSITATPQTGFVFSNWTGTVDLVQVLSTNKPTVTFLMESNLVLQATFQDALKPYLKITNPISTVVLVTNMPSYIVMGVATDDEAVASVNYSFNRGPWMLAAINGIQWSATNVLTAGTNSFSVYVQATNGNVSATDTVEIVSFSASQLKLQANGKGTISPNYSNALLNVGFNYSMTASPGNGFIFTNWTGGISNTATVFTNKPTVTFMMTNGLVLQANFIDTLKPYLKITNATSGMIVSNDLFAVMGVATDDEQVASVNYSFNSGPWTPAVTNGIQWSATNLLKAGTNVFSVYALATNGNYSVTNTVDLVFLSTNQLTVLTTGKGTISPNYSNAWLFVGRNYSITATPQTGFVFSNWTGTVDLVQVLSTNKPTVTFMMESNLVLQATFQDALKPYLKITNTTASVLYLTNANSVIVGGVATDDEVMATVDYLNHGVYQPVNTSDNWTNWTASISLMAGTNSFSVYAQAANGNATTDTLEIVMISTNRLTVQANGKGTLSPNYSNALLAVGFNYSMTATPANGFIFSNWTGGANGTLSVLTNKPAVTFMMQTGLVLQANFIDTLKPYLKITNPISSLVFVTNMPSYNVTGVATDDEEIASVNYSLNSAAYSPLDISGNITGWTAPLSLVEGTNAFSVYAVATNGNVSATNHITIIRNPLITTFLIATNFVSKPQAQISFDGTNYLVVFQGNTVNGTTAMGLFVSQSGSIVNGPLPMLLNSAGSDDPPYLDFDGTNYLVAWADYSDEQAGVPVKGVFVSPGGAIGNILTLSQSTFVDDFSTIAYGNGVYFLMWSDKRTTPDSIYGAFIDATAGTNYGDFLISTNGSEVEGGGISAAFDGTNFLAVWSSASGNTSIEGRQIIPPSGDYYGGFNPIVIYTNTALPSYGLPHVTFDGTNYLVLFNVGITNSNASASGYHVLGRFVTTGGGVLTNQVSLTTDAGPQIGASADFDRVNMNYLTSWNQGWNPFALTQGKINGRFLDSQGNPQTAEFPMFTPGSGLTSTWAPVYWDGTKFVVIAGLGHMLTPAPNSEFTNNAIYGVFVKP